MKLSWIMATLLTASYGAPARAQVPSNPYAQDDLSGEESAMGSAPSAQAGISDRGARSPFLGGVPSGQATPDVIPLSLREAIDRGLKYNLGLLLADQGTRGARGKRLESLSKLLPKLTWQTSETEEQLNLQAFGFPGIPGIPTVVGPFSVFDTRAFLSQPVFDLHALHQERAGSENLEAAKYSYQDSRDLVVLVCADLYLETIAASSRVDAASAELKTAQAIYNRAVDLHQAGVVPGIDVLRAQVEMQARQQRWIAAQNAFQKQKLNLARVIGLPLGQEFNPSDPIPYAPFQAGTLADSLARAFRSRSDYRGAQALVRAAESSKKAAQGEGLPDLRFNADYGDIGLAPGNSHGTFTVAANLRVPIFQGGKTRGRVLQADALLKQLEAEMEDMRGRIDSEVRTAFLDLKSTGDQVQVAVSARNLARQQLAEAQDRFSAGVANSLEVVQAQDALATADENYISSLYGFNLAKASLARATGQVGEAVNMLLGGSK